jgi:hypothetical protein
MNAGAATSALRENCRKHAAPRAPLTLTRLKWLRNHLIVCSSKVGEDVSPFGGAIPAPDGEHVHVRYKLPFASRDITAERLKKKTKKKILFLEGCLENVLEVRARKRHCVI